MKLSFTTPRRFLPAHKETVDASVESIVQQSSKTYEVAWTEVTRDLSGGLVATHRYRAFVSVVTQEVTDAKQALVNPLGLYVTNLTWGEVVTTGGDAQTGNAQTVNGGNNK
jgi:type IV secretion system protein VirB5